MGFNKKMLFISMAVVMSMCVSPAFADTGTTNNVDVQVTSTVSIVVSGDAFFGDLQANNIQSVPRPIMITSTSNVPIDVKVQANEWDTPAGNMPLSALQFNGNTPMTTVPQLALSDIQPGGIGGGGATPVNLYMQVPFGSSPQHYHTIVTWTAITHQI